MLCGCCIVLQKYRHMLECYDTTKCSGVLPEESSHDFLMRQKLLGHGFLIFFSFTSNLFMLGKRLRRMWSKRVENIHGVVIFEKSRLNLRELTES